MSGRAAKIVITPAICNHDRDIHPTYVDIVWNTIRRELSTYTRIRDARRGAKRLQAALGGPRVISIVER